uniref:Uncharacterized protein n=1 Tax=Arundo donax TaxID=35708 RepID=A0A0A9BCF8_ARUDO
MYIILSTSSIEFHLYSYKFKIQGNLALGKQRPEQSNH